MIFRGYAERIRGVKEHESWNGVPGASSSFGACTLTWAWALDVVVAAVAVAVVVGDGDVAVGAAKIPERTSGGWY